MGWIAVVLWTTYQFPQIAKIHLARSAAGVSLGFVAIQGLAELLELVAGLFLGLPLPSIFNNVRGIVTCLILTAQCLLFGEIIKITLKRYKAQ